MGTYDAERYDDRLVEIAKKTKELWEQVRPYMAEEILDAGEEYSGMGRATLEIMDDMVDLLNLAIADFKRQNRQMKDMDEKLDKIIELMEKKE